MAKLKDVDTSEVVAISDTPCDAEAAGKAGLSTIGFRCGFAEATLREAGCIAIYDGPADLLAQYESSELARRDFAVRAALIERLLAVLDGFARSILTSLAWPRQLSGGQGFCARFSGLPIPISSAFV